MKPTTIAKPVADCKAQLARPVLPTSGFIMRMQQGWRVAMLLGSAVLHSSLALAGSPHNIVGTQTSTTVIRSDGTAWSTGSREDCRCVQIQQVFAGLGPLKAASTVPNWALTTSGDLYTVGANEVGQAGVGNTNYVAQPTKILDHVLSVSGFFTGNMAAVRDDGTVWTWGLNRSGSGGFADSGIVTAPRQIPGLTGVKQVVVGDGFDAALKADGTVWAWGPYFVAPDPTNTAWISPSSPGYLIRPTLVQGLNGITQLAASAAAILALRNDGTVLAAGSSGDQVLGLVSANRPALVTTVAGLPKASQITAGFSTAFALGTDGTVWGWGNNTFGELGTSQIGAYRTPRQLGGISDGIGVAAGMFHLAVERPDGSLLALGKGWDGQLGTGDILDSTTFVPVNEAGGAGNLNLNHAAPAKVTLPPTFTVSATPDRGVAPLMTTLSTTGLSDPQGSPITVNWRAASGETASGTTATFNLTQAGTFEAVALARNSLGAVSAYGQLVFVSPSQLTAQAAPAIGFDGAAAAALSATGEVYTWGGTWQSGNLANGLKSDGRPDASIPTKLDFGGVTQLAVGNGQTFALRKDGSVISWGANGQGSGGTGSNAYTFLPSTVLLPKAAIAISANSSPHALALLNDHTVWAWGDGEFGALGNGTYNSTNRPQQIGGLANIVQIDNGWGFSAALDSSGSIWTWGANEYGQLGLGDVNPRLVPSKVNGLPPIQKVFAGPTSMMAKAVDGRVYSWGAIWGHGSLQPVEQPQLRDGVQFSNSSWCNFMNKADGSTWLWGNCSWYSAAPIDSPILWSGVRAISFVQNFGGWAAVLADGTAVSFGPANNLGQLGNGTLAVSGQLTNVVNPDATGLLDLLPGTPKDPTDVLLPYFLIAQKNGNDLSATLSDTRATGFSGDIYFSALLPSTSTLLPDTGKPRTGNPSVGNHFADVTTGTIPVVLGRGGVKQTGPTTPASTAYSGSINAGNNFAVYTGQTADPLNNSNAIICMGVTLPSLSAKGQVLMRPIATGTAVSGVQQCPTVQTAATTQLYRATTSGTIANLTLTAAITPQPEDRGQARNVYSWAVAPNGQQYMQTPTGWTLMSEPMQAAASITVPANGDITLPVLNGSLDLSSLKGTLVYVGMGSSWTEVKQLNKAGHYYTLQ